MELRYPKARLHFYTSLVDGKVDCGEALAKSIEEAGLISSDGLEQIIAKEKHGRKLATCNARAVARRVLDRHFREKLGDAFQPEIVEEVWVHVEKSLDRYLRENYSERLSSLPEDCDEARSIMSCSQLAPVILDILLQHIGRY